jgi:hypothetical protein
MCQACRGCPRRACPGACPVSRGIRTVASSDDNPKIDQEMTRRLSPKKRDASPTNVSGDESHVKEMLARFGPNPHTFTEEDRAKAVAARRQKAAERRERAMTLPEYARTQIETRPQEFFQPYEQARREGDWRAWKPCRTGCTAGRSRP